MKEMSMHILDIATNSVRAEAKNVDILVKEDIVQNKFEFVIKDDGKGMTKQMLESIKDPFTTSRTLRKVGLGIPLLSQNCQICGGYLDIESEVDVGTTLTSMLEYNHIDRPPLGDIASTVAGLITSNESINIKYTHEYNETSFDISTNELLEELDGVPLTEISVMKWLRDFIKENIEELKKNHA